MIETVSVMSSETIVESRHIFLEKIEQDFHRGGELWFPLRSK